MDLLDEILETKHATVKTKKNKKRNVVDVPVLYATKGKIEYTFILDTYPEPHRLTQIKTYIENRGFKNNYQIIYPLRIKAKRKDFTEGNTIMKFLKGNMFDLHDYIPKWSKIFTFSRMLYAITESNQINLEGCYDTLLYNTNMFIPSYACQVFPMDTYQSSFFTNSFENYFAKLQMSIAQNTVVEPRRIKPKNCVFVENPTEFFKEHMNEDLTVLDIETDGLDWLEDKIGSIQFAFDKETGYFLNWDDINIVEMNDFLKGKKIIAHNGKFDGRFCIKNGIKRDNFILYADTMNMSHVINELRKSNLKGLQAFYTDHYGYDKELEEFKEKYPDISYIDMPFDLKVKYGCYDVCVTMEIFEKMLAELRQLDEDYPLDNGNTIESYFFNEIMPTVNNHLDSEMLGIDINVEELYRNSIYFHKRITELKNELRRALHITDMNVNVSSGKQLSEVVRNLGWEDQGLNKDGSYTMNDESLKKFVKAGHKEAELILKLHSLETIHNTFVGYPIFKKGENKIDIFDLLDEAIDDFNSDEVSNDTQAFNNYVFPEQLDMSNIELGKGTGYWQYLRRVGRGKYKVFGSFSTCMAKSHRTKHRKPNLANVVARGEFARKIRQIYMPPKDYLIISADQAGLQLRNIAFNLKEGSPMRKAFLELGGDMHSMTACSAVNNNKIPLDEFIRLRKAGDPEITLMRYKSKAVNFGAVFGCSAFTLATTTIKPNWTPQECETFIAENNLSLIHDDIYATVANEILERFFKHYYGLRHQLDKTLEEARRDGYVRSSYGAFRRLPYLLVEPDPSDKEGKKRYANFSNIALNSPIQNLEAVVMNRSANNTMKKVKELGVRANMFTYTHDENSAFCHKDDAKEFCTIEKYYSEYQYPEFHGIPLEMEGEVSDYHGTMRKKAIETKIIDGEEVKKEKDIWELWHIGAKEWDEFILDYKELGLE